MNNINILESQIRQVFASVVWTHKIQEKQADKYLKSYKRLEFIRILFVAATSSGIFAAIFVENDYLLKIVTAVVSAVSLFISTYFKSYDLKSLYTQHKKSAIELLALRENIVTVLCNIKMSKYTEDELCIERDAIISRKIEISKVTPDATDAAVIAASNCLKLRQDNTYSDQEIDSYLPTIARKNSLGG